MRERFIDVYFDNNTEPDQCYLGSIIRGNESVNVLRIKWEVDPPDDCAIRLAIERIDGSRGYGLCKRQTDENGKALFVYTFNRWATACKGDLRISIIIAYPNAVRTEVAESAIYKIYPEDYQRMVYLHVDDSVLTNDDEIIAQEPSILNDIILQLNQNSIEHDEFRATMNSLNDGSLKIREDYRLADLELEEKILTLNYNGLVDGGFWWEDHDDSPEQIVDGASWC